MTNDPMTLPNVREPVTKNQYSGCRVTSQGFLDAVLWELALKNPTWVFKLGKPMESTDNYIVARSFTVHAGSEELGLVTVDYKGFAGGAGGYNTMVSNERIAKSKKRGRFYSTSDPNKAIAMVKKMFKPLSTAELVAKAEDEAYMVLGQELAGLNRKVYRHSTELKEKAAAFVSNGPGLQLFLEHAEQQKDKSVADTLSMIATTKAELATIEGVKNAMSTRRTALIVTDEGKYLVKALDNVQLYDDTTLPVEFREKLGMLKLVENRQVITDIGCRVSEEVFVVTLNEGVKE